MDKKELQNLIDRISLTGPEGIKKIKKVLKELNDGNGGGGGSSSGSMGEDEEYTIAQALNDLNERIEELKSQIAQQDYFVVEIQDVTQLTTDECKKVSELVERGVIFDTLIYSESKYFRVMTLDESDKFLYIVYSTDIQRVEYDADE